jgi:hypothetical protein
MAKFVPAVGDISGKIGNLVFSRNRYSPTIRRRAVPVNTRTSTQRKTRGFLSAASAYWRQVIAPSGNDIAWNAFAANFPLHQGKGTKSAVTVTGQAFSVAINTMRSLLGLSAISSPPDTWGTDQPSGVTAAAIGTTSIIISAIAGVTVDASMAVLVKATGPLSAGVKFIGKSKYRYIGAYTGANATLPIDITNDYNNVYGGVPYKKSCVGLSLQIVKIKTYLGVSPAPDGPPTACPGQPVFIKLVCS